MKTISKINETIYSLVSELAEVQDSAHDFNTRDGKICANIKVHSWLDEDDVIKICDDTQVTKKQRKVILKEFSENRLSDIHSHVCEMEVSHLKDEYEGNVDLSNFEAIFSVWRRANNTDNLTKEFYLENYKNDAYYIGEYWDEAQKFKTLELWKKHIIKSNEIEFKEWEKRNYVDKFECWQYGRSGGWFSICDESEVTCTSLDDNYSYWLFSELETAYNQNNNKLFNDTLNEYVDRETKPQLIKSLRSLLQDHYNKVSAITQIVDDIESSTKYFKECLLNQLEHEIGEFLSEINTLSNVTISIVDDKVKTSLGVSVPLEEFKTAFQFFAPKIMQLQKKEKLDINKKVGNYFVQYAKKKKEDFIIKAGCHRFSFNQLQTVLN